MLTAMLRTLPTVFTLILIVALYGSYLIIFFHKSGNWGLERSGCLSKSTLVSFGAKSGAHGCLMRPGLLGEHSPMSRFGDSVIVQLYFTGVLYCASRNNHILSHLVPPGTLGYSCRGSGRVHTHLLAHSWPWHWLHRKHCLHLCGRRA